MSGTDPTTMNALGSILGAMAKDPSMIQRMFRPANPEDLLNYARAAETIAAGLHESAKIAAKQASETRTYTIVVRGTSENHRMAHPAAVPREIKFLVDGAPVVWTIASAKLKSVGYSAANVNRVVDADGDEVRAANDDDLLLQIRGAGADAPICEVFDAVRDHKVNAVIPLGEVLTILVERLDPNGEFNAAVWLTFEVTRN